MVGPFISKKTCRKPGQCVFFDPRHLSRGDGCLIPGGSSVKLERASAATFDYRPPGKSIRDMSTPGSVAQTCFEL